MNAYLATHTVDWVDWEDRVKIFTGIGLWIINTRPVIWGRQPTPEHRKVRLWFTAAVITMSGALVLAQWIFSQ